MATAPPSPFIGLTRHNQNLPATKRHACQEHGASPTIFPVKIAMNILLKWLCQRILAVFGTDHCFDKIRLAKRFEIWFRGGCVASVANIRELYKCSSIFGHKNVGWQPKLLCGCGCMFRLGHRIPPRILAMEMLRQRQLKAVPLMDILVFTKSCCELLWNVLTHDGANFFWQHAMP